MKASSLDHFGPRKHKQDFLAVQVVQLDREAGEVRGEVKGNTTHQKDNSLSNLKSLAQSEKPSSSGGL